MTLNLSMFSVMEYLWGTLEKTPDGKSIRYTAMDIELLWNMGFVDTRNYSMEHWKQVFEPYLQGDGTFLLSKDAFLSLDEYRYQGEIHVPFDAMRINEGLYTDEGFQQLIDQSIVPSCNLSPAKLHEYFEGLKDLSRTPEGLVRIGKDAKRKIKDMIDKNPSPLRNLELLFDKMLSQGKDKEIVSKVDWAKTEKATARAAIEASTFTASPTSRAEAAAKDLKGIAKAKEKAPAVSRGGEDVALKKIRRSRKGMRG